MIHERVDHAHGVVLVYVVVHALGQQQRLAPVPTLDVARHDALTPERFRAVIVPGSETFGYWLGPLQAESDPTFHTPSVDYSGSYVSSSHRVACNFEQTVK